jgi:hypothetical protein
MLQSRVFRWTVVFLILLVVLWVPYRRLSSQTSAAARTPLKMALDQAWIRVLDLEGALMDRVRGNDRRLALADLQRQIRRGPGAFRAPTRMLFGAYDGALPASIAGIERLEAGLGRPFEIASVYQAWGDRTEDLFPRQLLEQVYAIGSIPMITWEPWVSVFDGGLRTHLPPMPAREIRSLAAIASGEYNFHIRPWALAAKQMGKPLFLRFAHEMNNAYRYPWGPQNGNTAADYIAAWRQVQQVFREVGATNVVWVWSPHIGRDDFDAFYPGDDGVDWVASGVLNYGTATPWSRWWSFDELLGPHYPQLARHGRPILIAEFATLATGGDRAVWYREAFDALPRYPLVRALVFFHQTADTTTSTEPLNWGILDSPPAVAAVAAGIRQTLVTSSK